MIEQTALGEVKRAIVEEARTDVVGLWAILWQVKQEIPGVTPEEARAATLAVVGDALAENALVAGDFVDRDEETAVLVPWSLPPQEAVARINRDWDNLGREPNLGDIVWFVDPRILPVSAGKYPMGRGWKPG